MAACSKADSGSSDGRRATIKHVFGETVVPAPPTRVVSAGLTEQDDLLAVGVVPIAITRWFGDQPFGVWPWAQDKLGSAKPVLLNLDNGIQIEPIAGLKPDLIVAVNAGLDEQTYKKLSVFAPTIAQSGAEAFFEPWKEQATAVASAVFKKDEMSRLVDAVDAKFTAAAQTYPALKDRTAVLLDGRFTGDAVTATVGGWRTDFLAAMGLAVPESIKSLPADNGQALITREELPGALDSADVLIWCTDSEAEQSALLADPAVAGLRATAVKRNVLLPAELSAAIAYGTPLSYPTVADRLPPLLARALG
jgi:iron complex transport system substrate-binding protein